VAASEAPTTVAARRGASEVPVASAPPRADATGPSSRPRTDFRPRANGTDRRRPDPFEERITAFRLRAEKVMIRLQKLEAGTAPGDGPSEVVRLG
jgi:hypothetical protein